MAADKLSFVCRENVFDYWWRSWLTPQSKRGAAGKQDNPTTPGKWVVGRLLFVHPVLRYDAQVEEVDNCVLVDISGRDGS